MAVLRDDAPEMVQLPLFGDDRLKAEVWFNGASGWEWRVVHRSVGVWYILDSGITTTWLEGLGTVVRVVGELMDPEPF